MREGRICGAPTRLARVSFTGELGFEVNVPSDYGLSVHEAIWAEGEKRGACAYGMDTLHLLRAGRAWAALDQRDYVAPDDTKALAPAVLGHRLVLGQDVPGGGPGVVADLVGRVPVPLQG